MKRNIIFLALIALIFSGCRKEADYHPYIGETDKLAYDSYSTQFEFLWKCLSTGYVFWDVDETDWDAVYDEYMPKFNALDAKHEAGQDVTLEELETLYTGAMGGLRDHHMNISVKNLFPSPNDTVPYFSIRPGLMEVEERDYYIELLVEEQDNLVNFLNNDLDTHYELAAHESAVAIVEELGALVAYHYCLFTLPDGRKIPYLWQSMAALTPIMHCLGNSNPAGAAAAVVDHWLTAIKETPHEQLAGIILDNRCNTGGYQDDLDYLIGSFLNEKTEILRTRYKEGPGRLEHSVWTPYYIEPQSQYHRNITAENIPYVVICDIYSISMGEIEPATIKAVLPTSHVIGERTFGATGPLQPTTSIDLNYGGPFGDINTMHHYVYTSTFEAQVDGKVLEGIGLIPDQVVLRKDYNGDLKPQLDAAIEYIKNYQ
jgi:hypothetical protein